MTGNELATAVQHDLPIVLIIANNSMFGTIPHAMRSGNIRGGRSPRNSAIPEFVKWAEAFGAQGERVTATEGVRAGPGTGPGGRAPRRD